MTELVYCYSKNDLKAYMSFIKSLYKEDPQYKDTFSPLIKSILHRKSVFSRHAEVLPVLVKANDNIVAVATYLLPNLMPQTVQIAFFEALPKQQAAVDLIVEEAKRIAQKKEKTEITIGLNGHVNYGIGFLANHFNKPLSFGIAYNPPYYLDYYKNYNAEEYILVSFLKNITALDYHQEAAVLKRLEGKFTIRRANFKNFRREIEIYTALNNICFADHPFYYSRQPEEDYELFKDLKLFIKEENLLFAEKDGQAIGFMLWYPDFNQLMSPGESIGIKTFIKNKLFSHHIKRFKLVEMGVLPEYQGTGAILGLFNQCLMLAKKAGYEICESSWILESNLKSKGFGLRWADTEYKRYKAFIMKL